MKEIGKKLDNAKSAYDGAMNKLTDSKKFGDTLVGRAERIKQLGANASKSLPQDLLDKIENKQQRFDKELERMLEMFKQLKFEKELEIRELIEQNSLQC